MVRECVGEHWKGCVVEWRWGVPAGGAVGIG